MDDASGRTPPLPAPRRGHLTEAQRRALVEIMEAHPTASLGQIRAIFRVRTGREIGRAAVQARRRDGPYKERGANRLTEGERAILARLLREADGEATSSDLARRFEAMAGRPIAPQSVWRFAVKRLGMPRVGRPGGCRPAGCRLTEAERAILARLLREADGEATCREVADQFETLAGRPIAFQSVWRYAVGTLGMPRVGKGRGPRRRARERERAVAARLAEVAARKRAEAREDRARVDNSPRVGKSGRYHPGGPS